MFFQRYRRVVGDVCEGGLSSVFEPELTLCPVRGNYIVFVCLFQVLSAALGLLTKQTQTRPPELMQDSLCRILCDILCQAVTKGLQQLNLFTVPFGKETNSGGVQNP